MKKKILVLDDHSTVRMMIRKFLGEELYEFVEAANAEEALEHLANEKIQLILCDFHLPGMNGIQFLETRNRNPRYQRIPVVMITSSRSEGLTKQGTARGVSHWVTKPFKGEDLVEVVGSILG